MVGKRLAESELYTDRSKLPNILHTLAQNREFHDIEMDYRTDDGRLVHCLISAAEMEMGGESFLVSFARDITELKNAQNRAAENQAALGRIFEASTDAMILTDFTSGQVLDLNREFSRLTGYSRADAIGRNVRSLNLWSDRTKASEFDGLLRTTNEARNIQDLVRGKADRFSTTFFGGRYRNRNCAG